MLKIWGLYKCWLSSFENDWLGRGIEPGPNALAHKFGGMAEAADFFLRTPTLTASNFAALWATDPKFWALKFLNLFLKRVKFQRTGSILRLGFAWSKWPHFNRAYLVTVSFRIFIAVCMLRRFRSFHRGIVSLWRWFYCPRVEPGPPSSGLTPSEQQNFFQISKFDSS